MPRVPSASPVPWFLYLLECEDGSLYTGVAIDVEARFIKHALGLGAAYTRSHPPLRVLACRCCSSRGEALRAEYALKQLARESKLAFFEAAERLAEARLPALQRREVKGERSKANSQALLKLGAAAPARN